MAPPGSAPLSPPVIAPVTVPFTAPATTPVAPPVNFSTFSIYINEISYDNDGTDSGEFIEVAHTGSIVGYFIVLYNGIGGASFDTKTSPTSTSAPDINGIQYSVFEFGNNGNQIGNPDEIALVDPNSSVVQFLTDEFTISASMSPAIGIALVDPNSTVVQFLSVGGSFAASDGPAKGMSSIDIGIMIRVPHRLISHFN